ncbi:MAG: YqhA family protein [Candidatus Competibacteraceae bacterium]
MLRTFEGFIETFIFKSRWLLVPLYLGLVSVLIILVLEFAQKLSFTKQFFELSYTEVVVNVLTLVDIVLIANLVIMVMFSGYETFISKLDIIDGNKEGMERLDWMGKVSYSDIKLKIIGSIVAISAVELLKVLFNIANISQEKVIGMIAIHLTLTVSGVLFALMERLMHGARLD